MLSAVRTGEEYFALRMASQADIKVFGNPQSRPHLPWWNGQTQVESACSSAAMRLESIPPGSSLSEGRGILVSLAHKKRKH
jgi:hypothetical protein